MPHRILIFGPSLVEKHGVLGQWYKGPAQKPLAEQLKETDLTHDTNERAIHLICVALEPIPFLPPDTRDFPVKVRETFAPSLSDLNKSYEDEAAVAKRRSAELEAMKVELEAKVFSYMDQIAGTRSLRFASRAGTETEEPVDGGAPPVQA